MNKIGRFSRRPISLGRRGEAELLRECARTSLSLQSEQRGKHLTRSADPHLFVPVSLNFSLTEGAVNKPAETPGLELPGRTQLFAIRRAVFHHPTGLFAFLLPIFQGHQEEDLPFHMSRYASPPLLIAVNCLYRCSEQLGHLQLGLTKPFTKLVKFGTFHS